MVWFKLERREASSFVYHFESIEFSVQSGRVSQSPRLRPNALVWFPLAGLLVLCVFSDAMAHSKSVSALKLSQIHSYWGDTETIVSKQGMRMNNKGRMGFSLVAKAPDWTVTVYRNDDKKYMTQSLEQFIESGIVSDFIVSKQDRYVKKKAVAEPPAKLGDVEVLSVRLPNAGVTYLPLGNYAAPQVESILYVVFKVSTNGGIPIKSWKVAKGVDWMTGLKSRGDVKRFLYTTSVKKVQVPATTFDAPHGYTKAASVQEVLLSRAGRDASGDIDELFEIGKKQNVQK